MVLWKQKFCQKFYGDRNIKNETFLESCGLADLVRHHRSPDWSLTKSACPNPNPTLRCAAWCHPAHVHVYAPMCTLSCAWHVHVQVTTCFGGRNRKCAEMFVTSDPKKDWATIEAEALGGQKLQVTPPPNPLSWRYGRDAAETPPPRPGRSTVSTSGTRLAHCHRVCVRAVHGCRARARAST